MDDALDLRGLKCPLPALMARRALARLRPGAGLTVLADDPLAAVDIPHMCFGEGHAVERMTRHAGHTEFVLRAAEVAQAAGYQFFMFDSRDTRADTRYNALPEPGPGPGWGGYWRFRPYWGYDPFGPEVDIMPPTRYDAFAEIVLLTPEQASHEARAVNAHEIIGHLAPAGAPAPAKNPV